MTRKPLLLLGMVCLLSGAAHAAVLFVDADAGGMNDGSSWIDAYTDLQSALAAAGNGDQIWVANGVYKPSVEVDVDSSGGADPREVTFQIPSGVKLYGGFASGEGSIDNRDWVVNPTILSGDIDNNDVNLDGNDIAETTADIVGDNAYHVIFTQSVSTETLLDGFIVTAGKAGDFMPLGFSPNRFGGGWYNLANPPMDVSSPKMRNSRFVGNFAETSGGAFYIGSFTAGTYAPTIEDCEFSGNEAVRSGGAMYMLGDTATVADTLFVNNRVTIVSGGNTAPGSGGAVILVASNASFSRCQFILNSATGNPTGPFEGGGGGAVYASNGASLTDAIGASFPRFLDCGFFDNRAGGNGGAWGGAATHFSDGGNLSVSYTNCVFDGNSATDDGGAVANFARTISPPADLPPILDLAFTNCTFHDNGAGQEGGALYIDGYQYMGVEMLSARIENSILYGDSAGNSDPEVFNNADNLVLYSLVAGSGGSGGGWDTGIGTDGGGNIDDDPQFVDPGDADGPDDTPGNTDDGLRLAAPSPAIDAGNDAAPGLIGVIGDYAGVVRFDGAAVEMGAYEYSDVLFVELEYFRAEVEGRAVRLEWKTATEIDHVGFRILRASVAAPTSRRSDRMRAGGPAVEVEPAVIAPFIPARGSALSGAVYEYRVADRAVAGTFLYYLEDIDVYGRATRHGPLVVSVPGSGGRARLER